MNKDFDSKEINEVLKKDIQTDLEMVEKQDDKVDSYKGDFKLIIFLSTDGKHTVNVEVFDPESRHQAVKKAMEMYDYIVARYGTKQAQAVREYAKENGNEKVDQESCPHTQFKFFEVKKDGPNKGKWFKSCEKCKKFLGWQ